MVKLFSAIDAAQAGDKYKIRGDLLFDATQFRAKKQVLFLYGALEEPIDSLES